MRWKCLLPVAAALFLRSSFGAPAFAAPIHSTGQILCADRSPIAGCTVQLEYFDSAGQVASRSTTTDANGVFDAIVLCAGSNQASELFVFTAACCGQSWAISSASCAGEFGTFTCESCGGPGCAEPPDKLVAWWPLDGESDSQAAEVAGGNHGTLLGGPTPIAGAVRNALAFDGNDEVQVPDDAALDFGASPTGDLSIDFWLNTTDALGVASLVEKRESPVNPRGYAVFLSSGRLALQLAEGGSKVCDSTTAVGCTNYDSGVTLADGQWHFVAITVDRDQTDGIRWYVDGVEVGTRQNPTLRGDSLANGAPLRIAAHAFDGPSLTGALDELELIGGVLAPAEIAAIYEAGAIGKCTDKLKVEWDISMCPNAAAVTTKPRLCNYSSVEQSYDLAFTPVDAAQDPKCKLAGPTAFEVLAPTTLPALVPPDTCRVIDVEIGRPDVPAGAAGLACYRTTMRNVDTGALAEDVGSLYLKPYCARPSGGLPFDLLVGADAPFSFDLFNPGDGPITVRYEFEGVASSMDPEDVIVSFDETPVPVGVVAGASIVTGEVQVPAGGSAKVAVQAHLTAFEPLNFQDILLRDLSDGSVLASAGLRAFSPGCAAGPTILCLGGGRFEVKVAWEDFSGNTGLGQAVPLTSDTGYFWFFGASNVELVLKVLDGRPLNDHFWVFYGALSSVEYVITVTDTQTGASKTYFNPSGNLASVADTSAIRDNAAAPLVADDEEASVEAAEFEARAWADFADATAAVAPATFAPASTCAPSDTALCLAGGRFQVEVEWEDFSGNTGVGHAVPLTTDTGYFWFFGSSNVELILKVLDGRGLNQRWWVFYGALSSVEYTITVTDTVTGAVKTYHNNSGSLASVADTDAFPP